LPVSVSEHDLGDLETLGHLDEAVGEILDATRSETIKLTASGLSHERHPSLPACAAAFDPDD